MTFARRLSRNSQVSKIISQSKPSQRTHVVHSTVSKVCMQCVRNLQDGPSLRGPCGTPRVSTTIHTKYTHTVTASSALYRVHCKQAVCI